MCLVYSGPRSLLYHCADHNTSMPYVAHFVDQYVLLCHAGPASVSKLMKAAALMGNRRDLRSSLPWEETTKTALDILSEIPAAKVCLGAPQQVA